MSELSPTPWTATEDNAAHGVNIHASNGARIGHTMSLAEYAPGGPISAEQAKAHALVMAAAPELLAMVRRYASECGHCNGTGKLYYGSGNDCNVCSDIRALITKATSK